MHVIKLNDDVYLNPDNISEIFINLEDYEDSFRYRIQFRINGAILSYLAYDTREQAIEGLQYLIEYLQRGGNNLQEYRELDGFEREIWDAYCLINRDILDRLMAKCALICSDPDVLLLMSVSDISSMLLERGMPWYDYNAVDKFQSFLNGNVEKHPEWFEMRV